MFNIIKDVYQSDLKTKIWFKWWTLCYFIYWLDRFSTDLDFDLIDNTFNPMQLFREILKKYGKIKDEYEKKFTCFLLLDYWNDEKNIKIKISRKKSDLDNYEIVNFYGTDIQAMSLSSIFANKLMAIVSRYKNRDLFDIYFFFKSWFPIDEKIILEKYWKTLKELLLELKLKIPQKYKSNTILAEIWDLISNKQKDYMKNKMVNDTLGYIDFFLLGSNYK